MNEQCALATMTIFKSMHKCADIMRLMQNKMSNKYAKRCHCQTFTKYAKVYRIYASLAKLYAAPHLHEIQDTKTLNPKYNALNLNPKP